MIAVNFDTAKSRLKEFCDKVADTDEPVIIAGGSDKNVVLISADRYRELEKAEHNAAYMAKLQRGIAQVKAGHGITKTMEELNALADGE